MEGRCPPYAAAQDFRYLTDRPESRTGHRNTNGSCNPGQNIFSDRYLYSFYHHFHASHPFVFPKPVLQSLANDTSLQPLLAAMRWIGSLYGYSQSAKDTLYNEAKSELLKFNRPGNGLLVQATMLLAIGLNGTGKHQEAIELLEKAKSMVKDIKLFRESWLATVTDNPILVESQRRTWWELYVLDGLFACAYQSTKFTLYDLDDDVKLPCEEVDYLTQVSPILAISEDSHSDSDRIFSRDLRMAQSSYLPLHAAFSVYKS